MRWSARRRVVTIEDGTCTAARVAIGGLLPTRGARRRWSRPDRQGARGADTIAAAAQLVGRRSRQRRHAATSSRRPNTAPRWRRSTSSARWPRPRRRARTRRARGPRRPAIAVRTASVDDAAAGDGRAAATSPSGPAVSIYLALQLQRPLFLEGEPASARPRSPRCWRPRSTHELIRLQCYEGLDISHAVYEWNYPRQILEIRLLEGRAGARSPTAAERELFTEAFLIKRPLLRAIEQTGERPPVLLIDEIDRADEEFEGYLLELLSDFQITIPELGTIRAAEPPVVVITSNRTREVHDALKRRCVYCWIDYPGRETERRIIAAKMPGVSGPAGRAGDGVRAGAADHRALQEGRRVRDARLGRGAGGARIANELDVGPSTRRSGILLKNQEDIQSVRGERLPGDAEPCARPRRDGDVSDRRLADNVLLFGRVLRAAGLRRAPRAPARCDPRARMGWRRQPHRCARGAAQPARASPDGYRAIRRGVRAVLPCAPRAGAWTPAVRARRTAARGGATPAPGSRCPSRFERCRTGARRADARAVGAWSAAERVCGRRILPSSPMPSSNARECCCATCPGS